MNIDEYIKMEKALLDKFRQWWAQQRRNNTDQYPTELNAAEWFERYLEYCDDIHDGDD